jgi:hypothetical protein
MAIVSTFELLTKRLIPPTLDEVGSSRIVVQGYFLTISNLGNVPVSLRLKFTATTPSFNVANLAAFYDVFGFNGSPVPAVAIPHITYTINVPANDTGLFILQPNVANRQLLINANTELRGYVDISLVNPIGNNTFNLLLTPEHRGTFLPKDIVIPASGPITSVTKDFDQLAYALPTAQGRAQYTLRQRQIFIPQDLTTPLSEPSLPNPDIETSGLQETLSLMWERLEELSQAQRTSAS